MHRNSSRRNFLKASVGAAGFMSLAPLDNYMASPQTSHPGARTSKSHVRKAVLISMLPSAMSYADRFKLARDVGFEAVEAQTITDPKEADAIKKASDDAKVRIHSVMNMAHWKYPLSSDDPATVKTSLEGMKTSLHNAALWGADTVLLVPAVVNPETSYQDAWTRSQKQIRTLIPLAEKLKVVIAIEEVWNKFLLSPLEMKAYVAEFKSPWIKAYFDVGFNNILTVINGYSEVMLEQLKLENPHQKYVSEIKKAGERAAGLTRQLLAFSRQQVLAPQILDLNQVIANVHAMLDRLIGEDIDLVTVPGAGLGRVKADPGQIEQVLLNLVVNARDAMPRGGKLSIETTDVQLDENYARGDFVVTPGPYVMLAVSDSGSGMDAETQKRIFEPFFTTKEKGKGTGLGLSTVYGIVKQSDGYITVYSEIGHGTTFKVYLPRVDAAYAAVGSTRIEDESSRGQETVLLVEDDTPIRRLLSDTLKSRGYQVLEASNGEEALLVAGKRREPIQLLLTDLVMPGMSGRTLAERMAVLHPEAKVLYMSGYTDDAVIRHGGLGAGVAFLQKPFTPDAAANKVRQALDAA